MVSANKLVIGSLVVMAMYAVLRLQSPDPLDAAQVADTGGTAPAAPPASQTAAPVLDGIQRFDLVSVEPSHSLKRASSATVINLGRQDQEPDYSAQIQGQNLPPAILSLMQSAFVEFQTGNIEYAAMLAQEALEISDDYPVVKPMLYGMIGYSYEKLGYIDMAIEQYGAALAIYPLQRSSHAGMRRLDLEFAATHTPLKPAMEVTQ